MAAKAGALVAEKYRLEARIGVGGMAQVWRARHEALGRTVAIKFLDVGGPTSEVRAERFLREARLAASLSHRHVVQVIDYGSSDDGQPYMVMEYLEGTTLADRLREEPPLSDAEVVEIVAQVASGLAAVHEAGIIHRDVKPDNVFIVEDGDGPFAKLLDFGVSKGFGDGATQLKLTSTGAVVGTPHYMSPEQARGLRDLDARTDLYSLGVVLYEALTGALPFDAENPGDILIMIVTRGATPVDELRPDLPDALALAVERAMAKDRDARYPSARELREALIASVPDLSRHTPAVRPLVRRPSTTGPLGATSASRDTLDAPLPVSRGARWVAFAGVAMVGLAGIGLALHLTSTELPTAAEPRVEAGPNEAVEPVDESPAVDVQERATDALPFVPTNVLANGNAPTQSPVTEVSRESSAVQPEADRSEEPAPSRRRAARRERTQPSAEPEARPARERAGPRYFEDLDY